MSRSQPEAPSAESVEGFRVRVPVEVRFRDTDGMRHVNNAVYLTYFEIARQRYWREMTEDPQADYSTVPFVLARAELDFRAPAHVGERLIVGVAVDRIGERSFDFAYRVEREDDGRLVAEGRTVQVMYNYRTGRSIPMPEELRRRITRFEGGAAG